MGVAVSGLWAWLKQEWSVAKKGGVANTRNSQWVPGELGVGPRTSRPQVQRNQWVLEGRLEGTAKA